MSPQAPTNAPAQQLHWFAPAFDEQAALAAGLRSKGGGGHQSKTMMLAELSAFFSAMAVVGEVAARRAILEENLLAKSSGAARKSTLANLNKLYGLNALPPVTRAMVSLWRREPSARPLLALLCALARDPLLRDSAPPLLAARPGESVRWPALADAIARQHPDRFSPSMLKSLAQNCASTFTQSGHLKGKLKKVRQRALATPEAAAFAAGIARLAGFGGPALVDSPWLQVLDAPREERLSLLRRAQGRGLIRMREAGSVLEVEPAGELVLADA